jgi:hypothetical protein
MAPPYEDAPLLIATGLIGVAFGVVGIRAAIAQWRERRAPRPEEAEVREAVTRR